MNTKAQNAIWAFGPRRLADALTPPRTDGAIYHWLRGDANPRFHMAAQIADLVNEGKRRKDRITVEDLLAPHEPSIIGDRRLLTKKASHV